MCMSVLSACMPVYFCIPGMHGGQKRALDTLRLELKLFVRQHVSAKYQTWVHCKSNMHS